MTFRERLVFALQAAGKQRRDLYKPVGLSIQAVTNVMQGKTVIFSAEHVIRTARFLGVSPLWLATGEGPICEDLDPQYAPLLQQLASLPLRKRRLALKLCQLAVTAVTNDNQQKLQQLQDSLHIIISQGSSDISDATQRPYQPPKPDGLDR